MSPGLKRAREPYRVTNAIAGLLLGALGFGIYAYSIRAVKQDVFDDVDEEARELRESGVVLRSLEDEERDRKLKAAAASDELTLGQNLGPSPAKVMTPEKQKARGILVELLDQSCPWLLDPDRKTLVWGAPPVDNFGRMSDPSSKSGDSRK
jgi:cytochrome c oxidase assembly factor 3